MKRRSILICFLLFVFIASIGILSTQNNRYTFSSEHENSNSKTVVLRDSNEVIQKVESKDSYEQDAPEKVIQGDDLVYREYSWGYDLEKGDEIIIEKDAMSNLIESTETVVVIMNGEVYREICYEDNDIDFVLEKSGNYVFLGISSEGDSVDIMSAIKVLRSADGGISLLNK